jgi:hypothetical protein
MSTAAFAHWQPEFEARGIPTFPVDGVAKRPLVRNYLKIGRSYSNKLVSQFANAQAYGFALRNRVTVLDCDSPDERVLADAFDRHDKSPIVIRSGGGNFQAWYKWNGERRHVRPDPTRPIDILGGGFAIGPGSIGAKGRYEIIEGHLDDLDHLPTLRNFDPTPKGRDGSVINKGRRNRELFEHCMRQAPQCDDLATLVDVAETFNSFSMHPPLPADEVLRTAQSAWHYEETGQNRFCQHGAYLSLHEVDHIVGDPHFFALLAWLRAHHGPDNEFMIADGLADRLGWPIRQLRASRNRGLREGWFRRTRTAAPGRPALYRWLERDQGQDLADLTGLKGGLALEGVSGRGVLVENSLADLTGLTSLVAGGGR